MKYITSKILVSPLLNGLNSYFNKFRAERPSDIDSPKVKSDRRDYGIGVRLWNEKDPRADQSFFLGGVPGFVLSQDQRILDWNIAFETAFSELGFIKRGMKVSDWYKTLDNFRRIPNREGELYGDAVVPITDRDRVVYVSGTYGRMVFMKIMSPILDRVSGRIIGWNITLNINSVTERVKFFEDLHARIQEQSKHARYVVGAEQILSESKIFENYLDGIVEQVKNSRKILIMGAVKSELLIEKILEVNSTCSLTVVDIDADALRHIRANCTLHSRRVHLVRKNIVDSFNTSMSRFDAVLLNFPRLNESLMSQLLSGLAQTLNDDAKLVWAGYSNPDGAKKWWQQARIELEGKGSLEVLKWHWNSVEAQDTQQFENVLNVPSEIEKAMDFASRAGFSLDSAKFGLLSGTSSFMVMTPNRQNALGKKAV